MRIIEIILFGLSVCADCFAEVLCSSIGIKDKTVGKVAKVALIFAVIQTSFLLIGWAFGDILASFIHNVAKWIALAMLLYVGGQMLYDAFKKGGCEAKNLNGWKNLLIGATATSIDALAIGSSLSLAGQAWDITAWQALSVFLCTALSVVIGIIGGGAIEQATGKWAEGLGGLVLIVIGISIVL